MASIDINGATITVADTALSDFQGRPVFEYTVFLPDGGTFTADDLKGPIIGPEPSEEEMLGTLLAFLEAAAESRQYRERTGHEGENEELFPEPVVAWAAQNSDEIAIERFELEEGNDE